MTVRIVRLGTPRAPGEGLRIGAARYPPRGVPKAEISTRDFYDVWLPILAPSAELVRQAKGAETDREWAAFMRRYRAEMKRPEPARVIDLLAAMSRQTDFSLGCYCEEPSRCHRSALAELLAARGAVVDADFDADFE